MSTVVEFTEQELAELQSLTREENPSLAIRSALAEYIRFAKRQELKSLSGQVRMEDNWQALEAMEMKAAHDDRSGTR